MLVLLEIITPAMLTALVVGLGIGLLQALTQIQEMTLVFVPKIVAIFIVLLIALPFAGAAMNGLMLDIAQRISAY
jgi:flagellar biosynthetic protein FliQ